MSKTSMVSHQRLKLCENVQGIVNPLMVQKTDKRAGTIVNSPLIAQSAAADSAPAPKKPKVSPRLLMLPVHCHAKLAQRE